MINGHKVIDTHCHVYPDKIADKAVKSTDSFYNTTAVRTGTVTDLLLQGAKCGIDQFVICSVATTQHQVKSINQYISDETKKYPYKLSGLGTMYPGSDSIEEDFEHLLSLNLKGVKLHPDIQKFPVDSEGSLKIYDLCRRAGIPVLIHSGDRRYDYSNPNRLAAVAEKYPDLTIVGAHFGGWSLWEEAPSHYARFDNFYTDCSSSFAYMDKITIKKIIDKYTPAKIMFGTDFPMWGADNELKTLFSLGLNDDELEQILHKNAEKVYKINR